jgi:hypothetical protein
MPPGVLSGTPSMTRLGKGSPSLGSNPISADDHTETDRSICSRLCLHDRFRTG